MTPLLKDEIKLKTCTFSFKKLQSAPFFLYFHRTHLLNILINNASLEVARKGGCGGATSLLNERANPFQTPNDMFLHA